MSREGRKSCKLLLESSVEWWISLVTLAKYLLTALTVLCGLAI